MPLVIKSLGGRHTHTHTHKHTDIVNKRNFKKPVALWPKPGLKTLRWGGIRDLILKSTCAKPAHEVYTHVFMHTLSYI